MQHNDINIIPSLASLTSGSSATGLPVYTEGLKSVASASVRWPTEEVLSMRAVLWDALIPVPATMADAASAARFASQKYAVGPPGRPPRCPPRVAGGHVDPLVRDPLAKRVLQREVSNKYTSGTAT